MKEQALSAFRNATQCAIGLLTGLVLCSVADTPLLGISGGLILMASIGFIPLSLIQAANARGVKNVPS